MADAHRDDRERTLPALGTEDRYRAPALDKGLDILEVLSAQPGGLTRGEIVRAMDRSPSEIYRMIERLVVRGYVDRSPEGDRYALSMKLFMLAHRHPPLRRLIAPAQPLMDGFAHEVEQSCHLVAPDGGRAMVVAQASCQGGWEFGLRIGASIDLLRTGSGQMLLAFTPEDVLASLARSWTGPERRRWTLLKPVLDRYRTAGVRVERSRQVRGIRDITVPILAVDGTAMAVLTCPFIERLDGGHPALGSVVAALTEVGRSLSL